MPRPRASTWQYFTRSEDNRRAICKYCFHEMAGLVVRMKMHLIRKCPMVPEEVRLALKPDTLSSESISTTVQRDSSAHSRPVASAESRKRAKTSSHAALYRRIDTHRRVAKAIFGLGLPVTIVSQPAFRELVLRADSEPSSLPTPNMLADELLEREFRAVQDHIRRRVAAAAAVCLSVDSWSESMNHSMLTFSVHTPEPAVLDVVYTEDRVHSETFLIGNIEAALSSIGLEKVTAVVTDTSRAMKSIWADLQRRHPTIAILGCCSQRAYSIAEDIFELGWACSLLELCRNVVEAIRADHILFAAVERITHSDRGTALPEKTILLPKVDDSKWISAWKCIKYVHHQQSALRKLYLEFPEGLAQRLEPRLRRRFLDSSFWADLQVFLDLMEPFGEVLLQLSSEFLMLSTFYHRFHVFMRHVEHHSTAPIAPNVHSILRQHWKCMEHPIMHAAHLFDPRYRSSALLEDSVEQVIAYLKQVVSPEKYPGIVSEITKYTAQSGLFGDDGVWESAELCGPIEWWKGFIGSTCPHLQSIAIGTLAIPASPSISATQIRMYEITKENNFANMDSYGILKAVYIHWNANLSTGMTQETNHSQVQTRELSPSSTTNSV